MRKVNFSQTIPLSEFYFHLWEWTINAPQTQFFIRQTFARMLKLGHIVCSNGNLWIPLSAARSDDVFFWLISYVISGGELGLTLQIFVTKHWFYWKLSTIVLNECFDAFVTISTTIFWRFWHFFQIKNLIHCENWTMFPCSKRKKDWAAWLWKSVMSSVVDLYSSSWAIQSVQNTFSIASLQRRISMKCSVHFFPSHNKLSDLLQLQCQYTRQPSG